mgnify:CR=1 FL=1
MSNQKINKLISNLEGQDLDALGGCLPASFIDGMTIPETVIEIRPYNSISFDDLYNEPGL